MKEEEMLYIVTKRAIPEVLLKVVEAKRLLETERALTVQEATDEVGISRSSFYKYKDDITPFYDHARGKTLTFMIQMDDEPGVLSNVLNKVSAFGVNILTIHQSIPVNQIATITISIEIREEEIDMTVMLETIEKMKGVQYIKILARE